MTAHIPEAEPLVRALTPYGTPEIRVDDGPVPAALPRAYTCVVSVTTGSVRARFTAWLGPDRHSPQYVPIDDGWFGEVTVVGLKQPPGYRHALLSPEGLDSEGLEGWARGVVRDSLGALTAQARKELDIVETRAVVLRGVVAELGRVAKGRVRHEIRDHRYGGLWCLICEKGFGYPQRAQAEAEPCPGRRS